LRSHVVIVYVLNQSSGHWLLFNALQSTIIMCLKLEEEIRNPFALVNLIGDDSRITFGFFLFTSNIKWKFVVFWIISFLFKENMKKEKLTTCFLCYTLKPSSCIFFCWPKRKWKYILWMNMIEEPCILWFWNVIIICIQWQNMLDV